MGRRHGKKNTVPKILSLQWIHSHVRQKNICNNNNNSSSYFVWFYFYFCYNSVFIMNWNKCLVIIFVTRASPTWVKWRTSALGTPPILQKVKTPIQQSSLFTAVSLRCFVLFCMFLQDFLSVQNKSIKKWIADVFKVIFSWQWNSRCGEANIDVPFPREKLSSDLLTPAQWTEKQFL